MGWDAVQGVFILYFLHLLSTSRAQNCGLRNSDLSSLEVPAGLQVRKTAMCTSMLMCTSAYCSNCSSYCQVVLPLTKSLVTNHENYYCWLSTKITNRHHFTADHKYEQVTLFDKPFFQGASITYRGPARVGCLVADGWNDRARSMRISVSQ